MNRLALAACLGAVFVFAAVSMSAPPHAKANWFGSDPCLLPTPPAGTAFTYDVAAKMYNDALRHEGDGQNISTLSKEDFEHAAKLVFDCKP